MLANGEMLKGETLVQAVLVSTYDQGRQPFGLASPAAWLRSAARLQDRDLHVTTLDLSQEAFSRPLIEGADTIAFYLPMHTASRLALPRIRSARQWNPAARIACYGLYAPVNAEMLRSAGVEAIFGGEFESALTDWVLDGVAPRKEIFLDRLAWQIPDRSSLPPLAGYARLQDGSRTKTVGYTEASRGCKHLCRHCPIVPVYNGKFRVVSCDVVLADIRHQVAAGAEHITFGDPDFLNGPGHALPIIEALHAEFPGLTYDVTIKVEHLLRHREMLARLVATGCAFVTSAVESLDDAVLARLDKGHTRRDFFEVVDLMRAHGLPFSPTFVTFTPWTTRETYRELLETLQRLDLIANVAPIQLAIRLLIPAGSRLLELPEVRAIAGVFNAEALSHPWHHPDPFMDQLCADLQRLIKKAEQKGMSREKIFSLVWQRVHGNQPAPDFHLASRSTIPYLTEPWYC